MLNIIIYIIFTVTLDSSEVRFSIEKNNILAFQNLYEKVEVITGEELKKSGGDTLDEKISKLVPGVNISRSYGIYSFRSVVSMRGYSSFEQSRTLVLLDGVPLNKSATGSVNWNMLSMLDIEKIEVFKGASSFVYGSNAISGVINIITKNPDGKIKVLGSYETYDTLNSKLISSYKGKKNSVLIGGGYIESDGYVSVPENLKTDYTDKKFALDKNIFLRNILNSFYGDFDFKYSYYNGIRGDGAKIKTANGSSRNFIDNSFSLKWNYFKNDTRFESIIYYSNENYNRLNEYYKGATYNRVVVDSVREDLGVNASVMFKKFYIDNILGFEVGKSLVNSNDEQVFPSVSNSYNRGNVHKYSFYYNSKFEKDYFSSVLGIRYDKSGFYEGYYASDSINVSGVNGPLNESDWDSVSYKIYLSNKYFKSLKHYISYGNSFRSPVIEDMCLNLLRGTKFTEANPYLKPEKVYSFETGFEFGFSGLYIDPSIYYDYGKDFIYEINTGKTININGSKPVHRKENVAKTKIYGYEIPLKYSSGFISFVFNYAWSKSKLIKYPNASTLEGKELTYSPREIISSAIDFNFNNFIFGVSSVYKSSQFLDDLNTQKNGSYSIYSANLKFLHKKNLELSFYVNNIFNERYQESNTDLSPGRITGIKAIYSF